MNLFNRETNEDKKFQEKLENVLAFLGALSIFLLPMAISFEVKTKKNYDKLATEWYSTREELYKMIDTNDKSFNQLDENGEYEHYNYYDFEEKMNDIDRLIYDITDIMV